MLLWIVHSKERRRLIVKCWSGCALEDVLRLAGLCEDDLRAPPEVGAVEDEGEVPF